jgi:hypothetical protein
MDEEQNLALNQNEGEDTFVDTPPVSEEQTIEDVGETNEDSDQLPEETEETQTETSEDIKKRNANQRIRELNAKAKAAALLHHASETLAKFVKRITTVSRLENTIIFSNLETCGHRCGVRNFKEIDRFTTFALHGVKLGETASKQFICL